MPCPTPHSQWVGDVRTPGSWRAALRLGGVQGGEEIMGVGAERLLCEWGLEGWRDEGWGGSRLTGHSPELWEGAAEGQERFLRVLGSEEVASSSGRRKCVCTHSSISS